MRILTIAAAAIVTVAGSTAAFAAEARLSDSQFIQAARCSGLASGDAAAKFNAVIKAQKRGRADFVVDKADSARTDGARLARTNATAAQAALASDCNQFGT